jgi:hypothetical protein
MHKRKPKCKRGGEGIYSRAGSSPASGTTIRTPRVFIRTKTDWMNQSVFVIVSIIL